MKIASALRASRYLPIYAVCILPAALLWQHPVALTILYAAAATGLLLWRHSSSDLIYFFVPFFMGPAGEFFAVKGGAWEYSGASVLPIWLPFVWGIAGLFMKNLSEALAKSEDTRTSRSNPASGREAAVLPIPAAGRRGSA